MLADHCLGGSLQVDRATVVSQAGPEADDVGGRAGRQGFDGREAIEERVIVGDDPVDLGLLEHDLGHQDFVGVSGMPPGEIARVHGEPCQQPAAHRSDLDVVRGSCWVVHGDSVAWWWGDGPHPNPGPALATPLPLLGEGSRDPAVPPGDGVKSPLSQDWERGLGGEGPYAGGVGRLISSTSGWSRMVATKVLKNLDASSAGNLAVSFR